MDYKKEVSHLRKEMKTYIQNANLQSLVIGMSGGIDSALVAAILKPVCDECNIPLISRSITIETNKEDEIARSKAMGELFCNSFDYIDLTNEYLLFSSMLNKDDSDVKDETDIETKIRLGNVKARMRMIYLYDQAQKNNGMVLSTDNMTEYLLGFWTINGDVGDYELIHHLWKTEVFEMSQWIVDNDEELTQNQSDALQSCIDATPTDGLGITSSDVEQLGAKNYYEVDIALKAFLKDGTILNQRIINRHLASGFKRSWPNRPTL